jgi:hypothetical protein
MKTPFTIPLAQNFHFPITPAVGYAGNIVTG